MEKFESQPTPEPARVMTNDEWDEWAMKVNTESLQGLNEMRIEAGLEPHPLESPKYFDINNYTGEFYD
jgi:hypothetical protein